MMLSALPSYGALKFGTMRDCLVSGGCDPRVEIAGQGVVLQQDT
jgi:hypothetical protein